MNITRSILIDKNNVVTKATKNTAKIVAFFANANENDLFHVGNFFVDTIF